MDIVTTFLKTAKRWGSQPALGLVHKDNQTITAYTWEEYYDNALAVCRAIRNAQLIRSGQNNFFVIIALNRPESFFTLLGVILAGGIPIPINVPILKEGGLDELQTILNHCRPVQTLANQELTPHLTEIAHPHQTFEDLLVSGGSQYDSGNKKWRTRHISPDHLLHKLQGHSSPQDLLIMPYTSGTTSGPKGVMLSHENILDRTAALSQEFEITAHDRVFSYLMLGHIAELVASFFGQAWSGYTVYFTDWAYDLSLNRESFRPHFQPILKTIRPTLFLAVPAIWKNLRLEIEKKLPAIFKFLPTFVRKTLIGRKVRKELGFTETKHFVSAAAKIEAKDFFQDLGIRLRDIYGQTETAGPLLIDGQPIGQVSVFVNLQTDEIEAEGKCIMLGYFHQPEATAAVLTNPGQPYAQYKTGDLGEYFFHKDTGPVRVDFIGRAGRGFKYGNGQFADGLTVGKLETRIQSIVGVDAVIICGEGKSRIVALVFVSDALTPTSRQAIEEQVLQIGERHHRIGYCLILSSEKQLIKTTTEKPKTKKMIKELAHLIEQIEKT